MNIAEVLAERAAAAPDRDAIIDVHRGRYRHTSYRELESHAIAAAAAYAASGLRKGDTLFVLHPMATELYAALIGAFRIGITVMFADPSAGRAHIERCCVLRPPDAFFGSRKAHLVRLPVRALRGLPRAFVPRGWWPGSRPLAAGARLDAPPIAACAPDDPALVTFTSGSTGEPKGIVRTHGFLVAQHRVLARTLAHVAGERDLTTLPVFLLANLASGLTSVIPDADLRYPGRIDAARVMRQIDALAPSRTAASPAFVERLVEHCERAGRATGSLRHVYTGGAPVFPRIITRAQRVLGAGRFVAVYGSTEAEPIAHIESDEIDRGDLERMAAGGGLLTGKPVDEVALAIIANQWGRPIAAQSAAGFTAMQLAAGETGEIVVSGGHVVGGYLDGAGDAETKFEVAGRRWHRTGDLGYLDRDGRLWLMGRAAACVTDGRGVLHPFAVECAAMRDDRVERAALLAHEGRRVLVVQAASGAALDKATLQRVLSWARLDEVIACERIPLDARHNAKVDYPALKAWLARAGTRR